MVDDMPAFCLASTVTTVPFVNKARKLYHSFRTVDVDEKNRLLVHSKPSKKEVYSRQRLRPKSSLETFGQSSLLREDFHMVKLSVIDIM